MGNDRPTSRREFLRTTSAAVAGGVLASGAYAAGSDVLRVGLVGCGGRGTGAAGQALKADKGVKLFALADAFEDRLQQSLATLTKDEGVAGKIDVPPERCF